MNNTEEISQEENKSEIALIGDENGDDQYLTELQHKFKKVAWQLFYPVWKSKGFRYGLLINYVAQLREGGECLFFGPSLSYIRAPICELCDVGIYLLD